LSLFTLWGHPTSLLAAPFSAPATPTLANQRPFSGLHWTPTRANKRSFSGSQPNSYAKLLAALFRPRATGHFIPANQRSVYSDQSQVGLFWPIRG